MKGWTIPIINRVKICNKHGFYNSLESQRGCPQCSKQYNKQYTATLRAKDRQKIYNSKQWRDVRELALLRDDLICIHCKDKNIITKAECVHHIIYLENDITLAYTLDNLISLCNKCHQIIHSKD